MFLLTVLAAAVAAPPPARVEQRAKASVMILKPHQASHQTWNPASRSDQREIVRKEAEGSEQRLRLTEYQ